jgi:transposase-like protein
METEIVYAFTDQPTTCPICSARTEIVKEFMDEKHKQYHECPCCDFSFFIEEF